MWLVPSCMKFQQKQSRNTKIHYSSHFINWLLAMKDAGNKCSSRCKHIFIKGCSTNGANTQDQTQVIKARDIKKQVPPHSPSPLLKYRQAFSLPTGRLHQYTSQMEPNKIGACWILRFKKNPFIPLRIHPAVANKFH